MYYQSWFRFRKNIEIFREIGLNLNEDDILIKKIDEIYIKIINALIRSKKFEDFEYTFNILEKKKKKNISLTKTIFKGLMNEQNYVKNYEISHVEDFNDEKKVNFYFISFALIFKNSLYIYNVPFLLKLKNYFWKF